MSKVKSRVQLSKIEAFCGSFCGTPRPESELYRSSNFLSCTQVFANHGWSFDEPYSGQSRSF